MTSDGSADVSPEERAERLVGELRRRGSVNGVTYSGDEGGAIITCYAYVDDAAAVADAATDGAFELVHEHEAGDEVYYVFGYDAS